MLGDYESEAYEDYALPMMGGRNMLKPTVVAFMLELLDLQVGERVLDVSSGTGFSTALIAHLVGEEGEVVALERLVELINFSRERVSQYGFKHFRIENVKGVNLEEGLFDKILISENVGSVPIKFIESLREDGLMVVPIDEEIKLLRKRQDELIEEKSIAGFSFSDFVETEE